MLAAMRRREALRNYRNRLRRGGTFGRLLGLDPMAQRQFLTQQQLGGTSDLADLLGQSQFQEQMGNRDFIRQLLSGQLDFERQKQLMKMQQDAQRGTLGGMIGGLVGKGLGGLF
jgi:hypothetical protein